MRSPASAPAFQKGENERCLAEEVNASDTGDRGEIP